MKVLQTLFDHKFPIGKLKVAVSHFYQEKVIRGFYFSSLINAQATQNGSPPNILPGYVIH